MPGRANAEMQSAYYCPSSNIIQVSCPLMHSKQAIFGSLDAQENSTEHQKAASIFN